VTELASCNSNGVPAIPPFFDVGVCAPIARRTDVFDSTYLFRTYLFRARSRSTVDHGGHLALVKRVWQ
jgi:hypothetical protein